MSLSLTPGHFFGLEAEPSAGLVTWVAQWQSRHETRQMPMSTEMLGNKDGEWKVARRHPWLGA